MKKYLLEIILLIIQILTFYIFPFTAGPTDAMGMVLIIIIETFILSLALGLLEERKLKYFCPPIIAVLFIPSVFIHYNSSALIHSLWYLVISTIGIILGTIIRWIIKKIS